MPLVPLTLPPGIVRPGTVYDARGRWYDANLVRWHEGVMRPVGGWEALEDSSEEPVVVGEPVRGMLTWRDNGQGANLAFGGPCGLWHFAGGVLTNISPSGLVCGLSDAARVSGAYGIGRYNVGSYGIGDEAQSILVEANSWAMDNFGEDLVAISYADGRILYWSRNDTGPTAPLAGAPMARAVVVTPERFVVALAADGDQRRIAWSDQANPEQWNPIPVDSQAGDLNLETPGQILAGRRSRGETLIWTDADLHALRYIGGPLVYSVQQVGSACGAISRHAMAVVDGRAIWMGTRSFFSYDGFVQPVPCDVADYLFGDLNREQASKIAADVRSEFGEVWWYYPSAESDENDRYVAFNWREGIWTIGEVARTAGVDQGAWDAPFTADAAGRIWVSETGGDYPVPEEDDLVPFAESGPMELGNGDRVMIVRRLIPDERSLGDTELTIFGAFYPTDEEQEHGPFDPAQPTYVRMSARQVRLRVEQVEPGWRFGTLRADVVQGGLR